MEHVSYGDESENTERGTMKVGPMDASTTSPHHNSYPPRLVCETSHTVNAEGSPPQPHELYELYGPGSRKSHRLYSIALDCKAKKLPLTAALTGRIFTASPIFEIRGSE